MKKIIYILLVAISFGFISCDNYYNNYKRTRAKVDKLLSERQFEKAREVVNENVSEGKTKKELLANITYTQINMLMEDGDYETASAIARELKLEDIFYDAFFKNIRQIIKRNRYDFVFETLMDWKIPYSLQMVVDDYPKYFNDGRHEVEKEKKRSGYYDSQVCSPGEYNYFIRRINNAVDIILQKVMYEGNPTNIRRCLMCYRPYCVYTQKNEKIGDELNEYTNDYKHRYFFKMQNTAKEEAENMLREAKLSIN